MNVLNRKVLTLFSLILFFGIRMIAASDTIVVSASGNAMFTTIQEALNSISCTSVTNKIIFIKKGVYQEKICIFPVKAAIVLKGEDKDSVILRYNDYSGKVVNRDTLTTHTSYTLRILSDNVKIENLTVENSAGQVGQAVAVEIKSDKVQLINCRFLGNQDTFYANGDGRIYCKNCYIEGTVDFIFGRDVVFFDHCLIHCKKDAYITAASTPENCRYGLVFQSCTLTADPGVSKVYLGRPWRSFANTVFLNCYLGSHILPEGWHNWSRPDKEKTAFYAEYNSSGPGAEHIADRVPWSHQLTEAQAVVYSIQNVFGKKAWNINFADNWNPL